MQFGVLQGSRSVEPLNLSHNAYADSFMRYPTPSAQLRIQFCTLNRLLWGRRIQPCKQRSRPSTQRNRLLTSHKTAGVMCNGRCFRF